MIPYSTQDIDSADLKAVEDVLRSAWLTQGPSVPRFEAEFAAYHEAQYAVAVSSATAALHIACLALGVREGSIVWTTPNSFVASANCALYCGAAVDFVDIDAASRNMSVVALEEKLRAARASGKLPSVVIPVDFAGLPCDWRKISALADEYGFKIIEDASHAVGASYEGRPLGSTYADVSVFSFHPVKIITSGEGGMLTTRDADLAARLRLLRSHGITREQDEMSNPSEGGWYYEQIDLGFNYRMTDVSAALGASQLRRLAVWHARRRSLAARYEMLLAGLPVLRACTPSDRVSSHHLYVIEVDDARTPATRADVFRKLREAGIGVNVHYIPIHLQPYYRKMGFEPGDFPVAEKYYARAISLPLFPALTESQQDEIVRVLGDAVAA